MRLVLDTNVVVAAFRSRRGASSVLLWRTEAGTIRMLCSTALLLEYEAVLGRAVIREATGHSLRDVEIIMNAIAAVAEPVEVRFRTRPLLRDPNDEIVIEAASNGHADAIVTHNVKDFAPAQTLGIDIATPFEILRRLRP